MDATPFDAVAKLFARRRLSRRQMLTQGGAGLTAAGLAAAGLNSAACARPDTGGNTTPEMAPPNAAHGPTMLFLQSFQSGTIAPKKRAEGRYTVTLEHGLGQTIYFSDRPDRVVGASPTEAFLEGLGFLPDNPPNAALVVETAPGETDLAVVELFAPVYDPAGPTLTYEVAVLENWQDSFDLGFTAAPTDIAAVAPAFGAAHLFIDGCPDGPIACLRREGDDTAFAGSIPSSEFGGWAWDSDIGFGTCVPLSPVMHDLDETHAYWSNQCNKRFPDACLGYCTALAGD